MIRVVLIDQPDMLTGLTLLLSNELDIDVQGTYSEARRALARLEELLPDVLITDQHPRDMNLVDLTAAAIQATSVRVLVLVTSIVDSDVGRAFRVGATGCVLKDASGQQLAPAVRALAGRGAWIPDATVRSLISPPT